ncbi:MULTISPECIES: 23S rRNA (uracil(1939)-C(5))-methyltransferase RlmD [Gemella]|uniref:23S rRNA (uracil(1939)-C(5))-methyltransferase RlmD n=1 Tax=Gemella TaxID=1378 RepID=UPI000767F07B|nr:MULTISPECIES: 23S rRNA (uracil(1939)-C(5))-methyltransferase RlmD [Gemella]AME09933.1 23S rRNA methyltransferase [Gemella sp. oral taxon 928]AXI26073.1 23S rRNA (uracil(1939)-C(5))-methyltransferase RlmD [Gemella sp. ND 6198]
MEKKNNSKKINILLTIKKVGINGEGIGYYKKKITFVKGALPDEVIICEIVEETPKYIIGKLIKIKEVSPYRVEVKKEYAESGAYQLLHVEYKKQLEYKRSILIDAFDKYYKLPKTDKLVLKTLASPLTEHYRNKNQFPVAVRNGKVIAGLYKEGTNELVEIKKDLALHNNGNKITQLATKCLEKYKIVISMNKNHYGVRYIATRTSFYNGDVQLIFVANTEKIRNLDKVINEIKHEKNVKSIVLNITNDKDHLVMGEKNITLYGDNCIIEKIGDIQYKLSANSFFQLTPLQTKKLYDKIVEFADLKEHDIVLDAFCGVGTIGQYVIKKCKEVYGVDIVKEAIEDANNNVKLNNLTNCTYVAGDVNKIVPKWIKKGINFDVVIVDPPRAGLGHLTRNLLNIGAKKIIYVSCNPSTLARDLKILARKYKIHRIQPIDMFPGTPAIEAVVELVRK